MSKARHRGSIGKGSAGKEARKRQKWLKKMQKSARGKDKPFGVQAGVQQGAVARVQRIQPKPKAAAPKLRRIGTGWTPKITLHAFEKLAKLENVEVYGYVYCVDKSRSVAGSRVYFEVVKGLDRTIAKKLRNLGTIIIDFENLTIQKISQGG